MRGSLREKRAGYWEVRIDAGVDRLTGKRVQVSRSVEGSRRDAERVLNTLISKHETTSVGGSTTATLGQLLGAWLEQVEPDLAYHKEARASDSSASARRDSLRVETRREVELDSDQRCREGVTTTTAKSDDNHT